MISCRSLIVLGFAISMLFVAETSLAQRGSAPSDSPAPAPAKKEVCVLEKDANGQYCANKGCSGVCKSTWNKKKTEIVSCKCSETRGCSYSIKDNTASCSGSCNASGTSLVKIPGSCQAIDNKEGRQKDGETGCICNPLKGSDDSGASPSPSPIGRLFGK